MSSMKIPKPEPKAIPNPQKRKNHKQTGGNKMGRYGKAAIEAAGLLKSGRIAELGGAWEKAICQVSNKGTSSHRKGCPRNAFLGLCEAGKIKGVRPGNYTKSKKNKKYAVKAVEILQKNSALCSNKSKLWRKVMEKIGEKISKSHNGQMDVVVSLWKDWINSNKRQGCHSLWN